MVEAILTDRQTCPNCPIFCRRVVKMEKPYELSGIYGGPQYETVAALGSMLLNTDPATIAKAHELCNRYGIDTISTGVCIAWAMECWERGIDLGRPLPWGMRRRSSWKVGQVSIPAYSAAAMESRPTEFPDKN